MHFFGNRMFFPKRPERDPAASGIDLLSPSAPAAIGTSNRYFPGSNKWPIVMLFGTIAALHFAREILIPLAFALILTFVLTPVVALLQKSRFGRVPSVALTVLVTMAAAVGVGWIMAIQLVDIAEKLPMYRQNIHAKMEALRIPTEGPLGLAASSLKEIAHELSSPMVPSPEPIPAVQNRKQIIAPSTPALPLPVQIVQQPANGLDYLCISALPPYAFPPARTMCKLIRERFPKLKLVIGVWGFSGDSEKAKARFERTRPDRLLTSLAQAVEQIPELIRPKSA
jgi:hypothetical protein